MDSCSLSRSRSNSPGKRDASPSKAPDLSQHMSNCELCIPKHLRGPMWSANCTCIAAQLFAPAPRLPPAPPAFHAHLDGLLIPPLRDHLYGYYYSLDLFEGSLDNSQEVISIAMAENGHMAVLGSDSSIHVWDAVGRILMHKLDGYYHMITISRDGSRIVGLGGESVYIWDVSSGRLIRQSPFEDCPAISADGSQIVSCSAGRMNFCDTASGAVMRTWVGEARNFVSSLAISRDGSRIISGDVEGSIRIYDAVSGVLMRSWVAHTTDTTHLAISEDASRMVSIGRQDRIVKVWDGISGALIRSIDGREGVHLAMGISGDGSRMVVSSVEEERTSLSSATRHFVIIRVFNVASGVLIYQCKTSTEVRASSVVTISPDGRYLIWNEYSSIRIQRIPD